MTEILIALRTAKLSQCTKITNIQNNSRNAMELAVNLQGDKRSINMVAEEVAKSGQILDLF